MTAPVVPSEAEVADVLGGHELMLRGSDLRGGDHYLALQVVCACGLEFGPTRRSECFRAHRAHLAEVVAALYADTVAAAEFLWTARHIAETDTETRAPTDDGKAIARRLLADELEQAGRDREAVLRVEALADEWEVVWPALASYPRQIRAALGGEG